MMFGLGKKIPVKGRVCLITGGAQGMGRLWAERFGADGARLALWDLNGDALETTAKELGGRGFEVFTQTVDVTDRERVYAAAAEIKEQFGPVELLVNNAGVVFSAPFLETPDEKLDLTIEVNLKALMWVTKACLPHMIEKGAGHVINVSSASGFVGVPYMPAYASSKWGVIGLNESWRQEMKVLGHDGIRFTLFCPSYVDTGMFDGVKPPLLVPILKPEEAVRRGYQGFRRGALLVKEPFMVKLTPGLREMLPASVFDLISDTLGVPHSMKDWKGRGK